MATRAIVTSHPVVACDVCGRSLLRGESPDVFLAGGQRRTVCELCIPRAAAGGWLREADNHGASVLPTRSRRAGSLLGRLRQLREPAQRPLRRASEPIAATEGTAEEDLPQDGLYDLFEGDIDRSEPNEHELYIGAVQAGEPSDGAWIGEQDGAGEDRSPRFDEGETAGRATERSRPVRAAQPAQAVFTSGELKVARALEVFNAGEQPRRVAGVARSLGAPTVTVRPLEESGGTVAIVVAWELCWYRYEVDLGDEAAGSQLVAQGMELDELPEEDRLANAAADERGELSPLLA
ncbi:MAG TPA: hypothetical protein VIJ39_13025 [Solirubrobacteraceae bacterium]